jgi:hypothetical protein
MAFNRRVLVFILMVALATPLLYSVFLETKRIYLRVSSPKIIASISIENKAVLYNKEFIKLEVRIKNAPMFAGVYFKLVPILKDTAAGTLEEEEFIAGPIPVSLDSKISHSWKIKSTKCFDVVDEDVIYNKCNRVKSGRYKILGELYDPDTYSFEDKEEVNNYKPILAFESISFEISDEFDVDEIASALALKSLTVQLTKSDFGCCEAFNPYIHRVGGLKVDKHTVCLLFEATLPFSGVKSICGDRNNLRKDKSNINTDAIIAKGKFTNAKGILNLCQAQAIAHKYADDLYIKRVSLRRQWSPDPEANICGTYLISQANNSKGLSYLISNVDSWKYNTIEKNWTFEISITKSSPINNDPDQFSDRLFVRVNNNRSACVVSRSSNYSTFVKYVDTRFSNCKK